MKKILTAILIAVVSLTLVACDTPELYTVYFQTGIEGVIIDNQKIEEGGLASEPDEILIKEGYEFAYWTLNGVEYDFSDPVYNDITIVAKWVEEDTIIEYTVSFDSNGGSNVPAITVEQGNKVSKPNNPTKAGYEFNYWSLDGVEFNFDSEIIESIKLVANWTKENVIVKHTVSFDSDGGSNVLPVSVNEGTKLSKPNNPFKSGYTFDYWTLDGKEFSFNSLITKPITLVASWTKDILVVKHRVTFDTDGGSLVTAVDVIEGKKLSVPTSPYKSGFVFVSWQLDGVDYDFEQLVTKPFILKATYKVREAGDLHPYYEGRGLDNTVGDDFRSNLKSRLNDGAVFRGYGSKLNPYLIDADKHPTKAGYVYTIYDGAAMKDSADGASGSSVWNKEHVTPKSWYNKKYKNREGDLHNLRISQAQINSYRSNDKFAPGSGSWLARTNGGFYPGDDHRGDSSRIIMYMMVMLPDMIKPSSAFAGSNAINLMLKWHFEDPVDAFEVRRNEVLFGVQKNRNPFIDHPEFAELIWGSYNANLTTIARFKTITYTTDLLIDLVTIKEIIIPKSNQAT